MERLLFAYAGVGLATGAAALALLALTPFWEKRYAARFRCIVWLALAVRLLVPFAAPLPAPAPQPLLLELPASLPDTARAGETQAAGAPPGQAAGTGESVASVPQASDRNTEPEIKEAFGTAQAAPREADAGVPSAQEEGRTEASGASRKTPVLRSGEILLPAPARLAGFVWLAGVGVCALWRGRLTPRPAGRCVCVAHRGYMPMPPCRALWPWACCVRWCWSRRPCVKARFWNGCSAMN